MNDQTVRTIRTVIQGIVTVVLWLAVALPLVLTQVGVEPTSVPGLATFLVILAVVAGLFQTFPADKILAPVGLDRQATETPQHRAD